MIRELKLNGIKWIDAVGVDKEKIKKILSKYDVHELDLEACLEGNQKARIDKYENYFFIIFHFPKYNSYKKIYELNEYNIFLSKDFIITFRDFNGSDVDKIFDFYDNLKITAKKKDIKVSSGYILYEITQSMLEKMFTVIKKVNIDLKNIENKVFDKTDNLLVKDIMIKKRNIILLKHMFSPQLHVLRSLEAVINEVYKGKMEVYFEDLEDKLEQIVNGITILQEYIDTIEDAFKSIIDIKTNSVMTILALFSAFLLPLTLVTSFYGMNITLPFISDPIFVYILLIFTFFSMGAVYIYLKREGRL